MDNEQLAHLIWEEALARFRGAGDTELDEFRVAVRRLLDEHLPRTFEEARS